MQKRVSFLDLDGTLLNKTKKISKDIHDALKSYVKANNEMIICTGRWPLSANHFNKEIEKYNNYNNFYLISLNGAYIQDLKNNKLLFNKPIRNDVFEKLLMVQKKFKVAMWIYSEHGIKNKIIYSTKIPFKKLVSKFNYGSVIEYNHNIHKNDDKYKILFMSLNDTKLNHLFKWLKDNFEDYLTIIKTSKRNIEITAHNVNKGTAVDFLKKLNNWDLTQLNAFGDSGNDVSMFETSGYRFAFKNKNKALIKLSNFVFKKNKYIPKVLDDVANNRYYYDFKENENILIDVASHEMKHNFLNTAKYLYLWNYIIFNKHITLSSLNLPFWVNKVIFKEFLENKNIIIKSCNDNVVFSEKEKKFIFAKSFSDTQIENLRKYLQDQKVKLFVFETIKGSYLVYENERLLNLFLVENNLTKHDFNFVVKQKLFKLNKEFKEVLSLSIFGIYPKELINSFKIIRQRKMFHLFSRNPKFVDDRKYTKTFKIESTSKSSEIFYVIDKYLKSKTI